MNKKKSVDSPVANTKDQNIFFFNSHRAWGGGEKWHLEMARMLLDEGYSVKIAAAAGSQLADWARQGSVTLIEVSVGKLSFLNPFKIYKLFKLFKRERVRTVILNLPSDLKTAGIAAKLAGVPRIIYRRGSAIPIRNTWLNRFLFGSILTDVIANSEETKNTVLANNSDLIPQNRIHVIYNGIDLSLFDAQAVAIARLRKSDEIILGHVGRLSTEKNQRFLIDVLSNLKKNGVNCRLLIAGTGPLDTELKNYAVQVGVQEDVDFLGFLENIASFMTAIDIFLLSSHWEGFGYVLVEAMAAKKPVVAFNSSSTPEIVIDGVTGYLVEPHQVELYAQRILDLANSQSIRSAFGQAGRRRVEELFSSLVALQKMKRLILK